MNKDTITISQKIEYVDKIDLYRKGNYIGSFDSYDEILKFFDRNLEWEKYSGKDNVDYLNSSNYSVIQSKHLKFSKGDN